MHDVRSVIIVGANLAGMSAARVLAGRVAAKVYDPSPALEWLPNIHELLSGLKRPHNLRLERGPLLARYGHDWHRQRVAHIDSHHHQITLDDGTTQAFSQLILCVGGVHQSFSVPGALQHALPFKSVADCQQIAVRLQRLASRPGPMRVTIVGGGIEGVEALGEILRRYGRRPGLQVQLLDSAPRLLRDLPPSLDAVLREYCQRWPVALQLGHRVAVVHEDCVVLENGTALPSDVVIWTGGVAAHPLISASHLNDPSGFAPVAGTLLSDHASSVFVVGDGVSTVAGERLPKQGYHAIDMGKLAARNLMAVRGGRPLAQFRPVAKPQLITFGDIDTFLVSGSRVVASPSLRLLKEAIYQAGLADFDRRRQGRRLWGAWRRLLDSGIDAVIDSLQQPTRWLRRPRFRVLD